MVERCLAKANVAGPNPVSRSISVEDYYSRRTKSAQRHTQAPLAQLVEQLTLNQWVPGSSP